MAPVPWKWLLFICFGVCTAWMDERPVLESRDGNLFISAAKDRNITLKILGDGYVNVNEINLLHVATAAESATRLIERWKTGYLAEVENNLQRLTQIVEGPDGLERRVAMMKAFGEGNSTFQPGNEFRNQSSAGVNLKMRMLAHRIRRVEDKVKSMEQKLKVNECSSNPCLNGGTCQDLYEGYQCNCPSNWEGPNCVMDVNECVRLLGTDLGCQNGATCHNLPGSYRCDCAPGWFGLHCTKKTSICNTQNSEELCGHGVCVAKTGSPLGYTCICDQGWQSEGTNPACIKDVDECAGNHRPCSVNPWVECRNAPGTFFCDSCPRGYTGNGYYCTDIDECQVDNGGCSTSPRVQCINTMGSRMCGPCPTGYRGDGVTCVYVGSCSINNGGCHPLATCVENPALTSAYVICRCPSGMVGDGIGPNGCQSSTDIVDVRSCHSNPCIHGRCVPTTPVSGYTCICDPGFTGKTCESTMVTCSPNPCRNNGVCVISNGMVACDCPSTYTGSRCETPRQVCGGVSRNPVGHLEFPIGGNVYQHGLSCAWVLITNSSFVLNVTFTRFHLERSVDCKYDFLQIHDGRNAGNQMIGRFCGDDLPHTNGNIISSHNSLYFWFHSDSSVSHDGFAFQWNSIEPVCGGTLTSDYGTISSPGSPGRYPPNRDCYWEISVRPTMRIQIHFGQLMLEEHENCGADFLEITSLHDGRLGRYCNHTHPPPLVVPSSNAVVYFHSDSAVQDAGFQIHYSAIEGIPGCNAIYTASSGTINSPTNVDHYSELECEWKIQLPIDERVQLSWTNFNLFGDDCLMENIRIYDGDGRDSPLLERYCGSTIPPTIRSNSNVLLVVFKSNALQKGTFSLTYNTICGGVFTEESGIIHSPMYALQYQSTTTCTYEIKQPPNRRIVLRLLDADVRGIHTSHCFPSYFRIFDGPDENSTRLANICGADAVSAMDDMVYYSTYNYMLLKYSSIKFNGSRGRGFLANYTTVLTKCGGIYKEMSGSIQMPPEGRYYTPDEDCIWTMQAPVGYVVQLTWLSFDIEPDTRCRLDYVKVYEHFMVRDAELIGTFCGSKKPPILTSAGNVMTVRFHSDSTVNYEGFVATYHFLDESKVCGGHFTKPNGVLKSPHYPKKYPGPKECVWVIEARNRNRVILNIQRFELESHSRCLFDYLEIRNGGYDISPLIGKFCGTDIPTEIISQTNQLYLKFVSDKSRSYGGFLIEWDGTTTGCGGTLTAANGDIISPNYPQPYMQQADCYWNIAVAAGSLVRLLIVDLQLESHDRCRFDYIEISEGIDRQHRQIYCSSPYPKVIQAKSNIMNVRFRSDFTNSGRGFHLKYETLCHNTLRGFYGVIESPNFPDRYEHNLNCSWTINAPIGNKINLTFSHLDIERTPSSCEYDYLRIQEGEENIPGTQLAKLCMTDKVPRIQSSKHQVFLTFITDSMIAFNGFRVEWTVDGCGGHLTRPFDGFTSPGYPSSYPTNVDCEWLIEVDYGHSIELTVHDILTEKQKGCFMDKLQIYGGESDEAPKLVEICYSEKPLVYTSFGNKMFVKFHSDVSYSSRGFNATYKSVPVTCGGRYTTDTGVIFSPNYPQNYPNKQNCEWLLQVDQNYVVNVTFMDFDVEGTENCTMDYVQIHDGSTRNSPLLGTFCGNELPPSFVSTSNEMLLVMRADSMMSAKGFKARYAKSCGARIIVKDHGYITPVGTYTGDMSESANCTWILVAENPADHVTVTFTHMEINLDNDWGDDCDWVSLQVFEGEGLDGPSQGKWCYNVVPLPITSSGNALTVHLYANYDFLGHFALTYSVLNSACGGTYTSSQGLIASPGYPNTYPLNAECIWILNNSPGNKLSLTFSTFDLQQSENCDLDYLEIRENSGIGKLITIACGTDIEPVQTSEKLWIKFKSDGDDVGKGFVGEYTITGGSELSGPSGRITSPLYPIPFKKRDTISWRITVDFGWMIQIEITDSFIENYVTGCFSYLRVYDGYDSDASILLETCGLNIPDPVTTTSNVAYVEMTIDALRQGSWFDLTWLRIPKNSDNFEIDSVKLNNCTQEVSLVGEGNNGYDFTSPGYPNGYDTYLRCTWLFTSPPGTHLVLRILSMDLEETSDCVADFVAVYSGNALTEPNNANLVQKLCLANATSTLVKAGNVMTVKFESDSYLNETGFSAYVYKDCGGKLEGPNGVIEINNSTTSRNVRSWQVLCEWAVEVRPGRTIEVIIEDMAIQQGPSWTCTDNYLMLKNGGEATSPLLGVGKYCGDVIPAPLETTGNRLYVKVSGIRSNVKFKLNYREVSMKCGGEFMLSSKQKKWEVNTPNYPNIPPPFSECMWTALAPNKERISLHFVERFDLSDTLNCEKEYVEVRDGGTESSKLLGKFCKNVAPSTMTSMGNVMYMRFYTDVSEPKNGFKAVFSIGEACGGIIRGTSGTISSPNYPFFYPKNVTCVWRVVAPTDHTLKFTFMDIQLPGFRRCRNTDHVQINEILPGNDTDINIGTYCALTLPDVVETASNQANVIFKSDNFEFTTYRGFNLQFVASQEVCGGEFTALQGIIKSNGYPNVATRSRYCDWLIKLPKGFQVVVEILDLDVIPMPEPRVGFSLSFYNDFRFRSRIIVVGPNSTQDRIKSSSNTMMIGYYSAAGYRGFKLRYYAAAPAPCGGILKEVKGNISGPTIPPFNQSSYFCQWSVEPPETLANNYNNTGLTLSLKASGVIGGIRSHAFNKYCFNYQYISLSGVGMICGNLSDPVYLRSPMKTNELIIVNGTYGKTMRFDLEYQWQPCGGILQGLSHVITAPKNISYPINCAWFVKYPDNGEMIRLHFNRLRLGGCDKNYITVRNGGPFSPEMGMFCGNYIPNNITSTSNQLWIEYMSSEEPNDFEFVLEPANNGCGGALRGSSREISSPKFPSQYPNNAECTWEITAENGYHIGLTFVDRFNLENSNNCEKDYVQIFDWVNEETNGSYKKTWKSLGKVCGRNTPLPFNTTSNRMKVVFRSNEAIQGDGFRAIWNQNCGGIFEATSRAKIIQSPSYPDFYHPNSFCNYTILAPKKDIIIEFTHFQLEQSRRDCRFDNVTIKTEDKYSSTTEGSWCGENKPPLTRSTERAEIIFKSDRYVQRTGFVFKYLTNDCGGTLTAPGEIKPIMNGVEYFGDTDCVWKIKAPSDKNVVLRFEEFQLEYGYGCSFDNIKVYDGLESKDENRLAMLCGDLTYNLPVIKSTSNSMLVEFFADSSRHFKGFSAKILFTKSVEAGCGGNINLTTAHSQQFKTQKGSMYESLEDCHWTVQAPLGKNIKLTINSIDVKNATNRTVTDSECTGDYLEVRDGIGPFSELLGKFCGSQPPVPILSGSNKLWIRFYSDGTLEGNGVSGTLETINALCSYAEPIVNDTKFILTSPNYPYSYGANARCRWTLTSTRLYDGKLRIRFLDFDLADSSMCESDFLQITDTSNRKYIEEGFGEDFVWTGNPQSAPYAVSHHMPSTSYKYCGNSLPHDYFSYNTEIELSFKGSTTGHRGFKIEYGAASCDRNYTSEQGRILHESVNDCWITITAPANYTVSIYFNQFMLYDPDECTRTSLQVYDGGFNGKLLASLCSMEVPSPIFSTGNKLSLHSWSEWHTTYEYYDITYTTTNAGRGCGGRLYNYAGSFTSPMYPNEYRENTECVWDITVPKGLKVFLEFTVFDIGTKNTCSENYNMVKIYDFTESGERMLMTTYCGGDNPAPFEANGNHVAVIYKSSLNNIGTGWMANFKAKAD